MERRTFSTRELRMSSNGNTIRGTAATYLVRAKLPGFHERIAKRAFDRILSTSPDVCILFNHNENLILGRTSAGTLRLNADDTGLHYECDLPNTTAARDLKESLKRGDVKHSSFAFNILESEDTEWSEEEDENRNRIPVRTIKNFRSLHDVSPVVYAAYDGTSASVDRSTVIAAEVRSRAESISRVHVAAKKSFRAKLDKLSDRKFDAWLERFLDGLDARQRRKDLLDFVLD